MNRPFMSRVLVLSFALMVIGLATSVVATQLRADDKPSDLAKNLVGTWAIAGTPDKPEEPAAKGGRLKFFTGKCWCITDSNPADGKVIFHHGGTYTLDGDKMAETIEYANENTAAYIGKTHKFTIKVEGDVYTQVGDGNEFTERWVRVK